MPYEFSSGTHRQRHGADGTPGRWMLGVYNVAALAAVLGLDANELIPQPAALTLGRVPFYGC